jgi:hypothetical protein
VVRDLLDRNRTTSTVSSDLEPWCDQTWRPGEILTH